MAVQENLVWEETIVVAARSYWDYRFQTGSVDGYFVFDINVNQPVNQHDIRITVYDETRYEQVRRDREPVRAGARAVQLPTPGGLLSAKIYWGMLYFKPTQAGTYYAVLDNTHSSFTAKTVTFRGYWRWTHSAYVNYIRNSLAGLQWTDLWTLIENAKRSMDRGANGEASNNLRSGLATLELRVCQTLEGKKVQLPSGKGLDQRDILKILAKHDVSDHMASFINRIWSLASELSHIEKEDGRQPTIEDVTIAFNSVTAAYAYLISILRKKMNGS